jgi:hypothetical protein
MSASRWSTRCLVRGLVVALAMSICVATPAGAVGDAQLSQQIIRNPVPGFQPIPTPNLQSRVNYLSQLEQSAIGPFGGKASIAANGWFNPSTKSGIEIILVAFSYPHASDHDLRGNAASAGLSFCAAGTASSPMSNTPIPGIPDSHLVQCQRLPSGAQPIVAAWVKANVLGMVVTGSSIMSPAQLTSIAIKQFNAMSSADTQIVGGSDTALIIGLIAAGVVLVGVIVSIVLVVRVRKRKEGGAQQATSDMLELGRPISRPGDSLGDWGPAADDAESTPRGPASPLEGDA